MKGKAHVYLRDDINTDEIIPARYMVKFDEKEMGSHCLEDLDAGFTAKVSQGDFLVAGHNFGCGSSREHAVWALRGAGVRAVIASSFARIFMRNAINGGFLVIEAANAAEEIGDGDELEIDPMAGEVRDLTNGRVVPFKPMPGFALEIIESGGLLEYLKNKEIE